MSLTVSEDEVIHELKETIRRNYVLAREVEVVRFIKEVPKLKNDGIIKVLPEQRRAIKKTLKKPLRNDPHAILIEKPLWDDDPVIFRYKSTDYIGVCFLSENNTVPVNILSASMVVLCAERRELYLHRRSLLSRTYPSHLHTIGGAFKPGEDVDLIETAQRELREETKMHFQRSNKTQLMLTRELKTGFIQLVLLAVEVTPEEVAVRKDSWEGDVVVIGFDSLPDKLLKPLDKIVPTGLIHLLAWLGLGAPPLDQEEKFSGNTARELYQEALKKLSGH